MMRISAGAALRAWAVDRKLSSSPVPCFSLFLDPSVCTEDFRFGAMAKRNRTLEEVAVTQPGVRNAECASYETSFKSGLPSSDLLALVGLSQQPPQEWKELGGGVEFQSFGH